MKKIWLIPILLATTSLPLVSITGCNKDNIEDYQVTDEEFIQIISLSNVALMQTVEKKYNDSVFTKQTTIEYSDYVAHKIQIDNPGSGGDQTYAEGYVKKNSDNTYSKWERSLPTEPFVGPTSAVAEQFDTIESVGQELIEAYEEIIASGYLFLFNANKKCYFASGPRATLEFYFYKKQLIFCKDYIDSAIAKEMAFTYEQITPTPPTIK